MNIYDTSEGVRLVIIKEMKGHWNRWGPFLAERAWGTVREDYSADGTRGITSPMIRPAPRLIDGMRMVWWKSPTGDQHLCFALALWNGRDPFLKERLFGLPAPEGNHGEDVKEYYFYL